MKYLDETDKKYLKTLVDAYLGNISEQDFKNVIDSLSNFSDKAKNFWNDHLGAISAGINIILAKLGLSGIEVKKIEESGKLDKSLKYQLEKLQKIIFKMKFTAIYILIDKVDEADITGNDASLSSKLIEPLLKDLDLLEMPGYGFKFFLWEKLERYYSEYGRKDRINYYSLVWKNLELRKMLSKRLEAYSNNKINNFSQIVDYDYGIVDINSILILFAQKSPRDVIRIIQHIIAGQREINPYARKISYQAIMKGLDTFSQNRASEIIDTDDIRELRKIGQIEFTISFLSSKIYKCPQNTVRTKIKKWTDLGIIEKIGTQKGKKKLVNKYSICDIRIAKNILPEINIEKFLSTKYRKCPKCFTDLLRDWDTNENGICHNCSSEIKNVGDKISRPFINDTQQKSLFEF